MPAPDNRRPDDRRTDRSSSAIDPSRTATAEASVPASESVSAPKPADDFDVEQLRARMETFAKWSDDVYTIPFTSVRIGLEPLIGLIPGVGDGAGIVVGAYVPLQAWRAGAPGALVRTMWRRVAVDAAVGLVPVFGDILDITYRANRRNVNDFLAWLDEQEELGNEDRRG